MRSSLALALCGCLLLGAAAGHGEEGAAGDELSVVTRWTEKAERPPVRNLDILYRDHDDRAGVLRDLAGKPLVITFFYTRCQNYGKCSLAVSRLGVLQRQLEEKGLAGKRASAITYEPQFDSPDRIHRFAADRGLELGDNALALQLDEKETARSSTSCRLRSPTTRAGSTPRRRAEPDRPSSASIGAEVPAAC